MLMARVRRTDGRTSSDGVSPGLAALWRMCFYVVNSPRTRRGRPRLIGDCIKIIIIIIIFINNSIEHESSSSLYRYGGMWFPGPRGRFVKAILRVYTISTCAHKQTVGARWSHQCMGQFAHTPHQNEIEITVDLLC